MAILSFSELHDIGQVSGYQSLGEARSFENSLRKSAASQPKIFLSHSHADSTTHVLWAIRFLKKIGVDAFIDWLDPAMPKTTDANTALLLREKIGSCQKFILLATPNALSSRWVPWELGYADSKKGFEHIAILPIRDDGREYVGNEYVRVYPSIERSDSGVIGVFPAATPESGAKLSWWITN